MVLSNCAGVTRFCTKTALSGRVRHPEAVLHQEVCKEPVGGKVLPVPRDLFIASERPIRRREEKPSAFSAVPVPVSC